ncbi:MAG TPA: metallophosphoesterase family protein, partial [Hanamia sp.]
MKNYFSYILLLTFFPFVAFSQTKPATPKTKKYGFTPALIRGPYLQVATSNSIIIRWRTDENDVSFVRYGTDVENLNLLAGNSYRTMEHLVTLNNLKPQTKYYYLIEGVRDTLQWEENNYFVTLPEVGTQNKYRIGIFGDCGNNSINQRNTRDQFEKFLGNDVLNAWILLGDNAYSFGKDEEYQANFFNIYKDGLLRKSPLFPAPGNHDYHDERFSADHAQ